MRDLNFQYYINNVEYQEKRLEAFPNIFDTIMVEILRFQAEDDLIYSHINKPIVICEQTFIKGLEIGKTIKIKGENKKDLKVIVTIGTGRKEYLLDFPNVISLIKNCL